LPSKREVIPEVERPDFEFIMPDGSKCTAAYVYWAEYHEALGQELAKRIRREA